MNAKWLNSNSKKCPKCKTPIQKSAGCNWMTCYNCKNGFCWLCLGGDAEHDIWFDDHRRPCHNVEDVKKKGREEFMR